MSRKGYGKAPERPGGEAMSELETAAQPAIAAAGGDSVLALLHVLSRNTELERELALSRAAVSNGFSRGWHKGRT
ncbi:hypothetical protein FJ970_25145 [Mesorhizobium sp. B2-1-8]|uniref:hypothetical protein n=1 Tax=unclassified Mesorhizobium TaxID=325217 RepID=UPI00112EE444|nr:MULTISPECIES: hypothetical protein [unclassified Mesorhizobium]MBZ9673171.1 hypothetical protein [Mesorhizobium sp. ES1-3]TPI20820.1 hypothetical protein FJW08_31790 [Mesorhizobium sp. B3-2-1]UCI18344.1 hypothetical protein FJ970_25145 [Mesorhizobium sp. B2-1-8]